MFLGDCGIVGSKFGAIRTLAHMYPPTGSRNSATMKFGKIAKRDYRGIKEYLGEIYPEIKIQGKRDTLMCTWSRFGWFKKKIAATFEIHHYRKHFFSFLFE